MRNPVPRAIFLVAPFLAVHNLEEALTIRAYLAEHVGVQLPLGMTLPGANQFYVALAIVTVILFAALLAGRMRGGRFPLLEVMLALQLVMMLNVASHAGQALLVRGYVPGLVTAFALNLPFSLYLFHRAFWERWIPRGVLATLVPVAIVVHGPVLFGLMWVAGRVA